MPTPSPEMAPSVGRAEALVVDARFDGETFTLDTTTIDGRRVVVMQQRDGVRYLLPSEALALARALLSRLAYVGFPESLDPRPFCGDHVGGSHAPCAACSAARRLAVTA